MSQSKIRKLRVFSLVDSRKLRIFPSCGSSVASVGGRNRPQPTLANASAQPGFCRGNGFVPRVAAHFRQPRPLGLPERLQLGGGAPGHLPRVIGRNRLIVLVHRCPPMTNPLQQASKTQHVSAGVSAQREACPVAVRRELAALARTARQREGRGWPASLTLDCSTPLQSSTAPHGRPNTRFLCN
jgi:hypothetical protein